MSGAFRRFYGAVRSRVSDPMEQDWVLHSTVGVLYMQRISWNEDDGVICIDCIDEHGNYRFLAFTESQMENFVIEVKKRVAKKTIGSKVGFQTSAQIEEVTVSTALPMPITPAKGRRVISHGISL